MKKPIKHYWTEPFDRTEHALLISIIMCVVLQFIIPFSTGPVLFFDSYKYLSVADYYILHGPDPSTSLIEITPGYPLFLAALKALSTSDAVFENLVIGFNIVLIDTAMFCAGYIIYLITGKRKAALLCTLLSIFSPLLMYQNAAFFTEPLFMFFLFSTLLSFCLAFHKKNVLLFLTGYILFFCTGWVRSSCTPLFFLPLAFFAWEARTGWFKGSSPVKWSKIISTICLCLILGSVINLPMKSENATFKEKSSVFWIRAIMNSDSGQKIYDNLFPNEKENYADWIRNGATVTHDPDGTEHLQPVFDYSPEKQLRFFSKGRIRWWWRSNWYASMYMGMTENEAKRKAGQQAIQVLKENWKDCLQDSAEDIVSVLSRPLRGLSKVVKNSKKNPGLFGQATATLNKAYIFLHENHVLLIFNLAVIAGLISNMIVYRNPGYILALLLIFGSLGINVILCGDLPRYAETTIPFSGFGLYGIWTAGLNFRSGNRENPEVTS